MALDADGLTTGAIRLIKGDPGQDFIDYEFANGVVTGSTNSLGLALPGVGSSASFNIGIPTEFDVSVATLDPANGPLSASFIEQANPDITPTPELAPLMTTAIGIGVMALMRKRMTARVDAAR
jgi:hypothetical protein